MTTVVDKFNNIVKAVFPKSTLEVVFGTKLVTAYIYESDQKREDGLFFTEASVEDLIKSFTDYNVRVKPLEIENV